MLQYKLILNFFIACFSTFGFAVFMHTPKRVIIHASITGGLGWFLYDLSSPFMGEVFASFLGACMIGICGEFLARKCKCPSIVFLIPGMLPLVPGRGLYLTMEALIDKQYLASVNKGVETFAIAGAIAFGLIFTTSTARLFSEDNFLKRKKQESV